MARANDRLLLGQRLLLAALVLVMAGSAWLLWQRSTRPLRTPGDVRASTETPAAPPLAPASAASEALRPPAEEREVLAVTPVAPASDPLALEAFAPDACYGRVSVEGVPEPEVELAFFLDGLDTRAMAAPAASTRSDAEGRFRVTGLLPHRTYSLAACAPRIVPTFEGVYPGEALTIELERAVPVTGVVLRERDGSPLADVSVAHARAHWNGAQRLEREQTRTDAEGRFRLAWAREDLITFLVTRPGQIAVRREFQVSAASTTPFEIRLADESALEFVVVDLAQGEPLVATELATNWGPVHTDAEGRLALPLPAVARTEPDLYVSLGHEGDVRTEGRLPAASGGPLARVPIARGAVVRGRVLDAEGAPVQGASLRLGGGSRAPVPLGLPEGFRLNDARQIVRSDAEGRFTLAGLVPRAGEVRVRATHALHPQGESEPFALTRLGAEHELELRLERGGSVAGRVTLAGEPVALDVHWSGSQQSGRTRSNARGEFRLSGLPVGALTLSPRLDGEEEDVPRAEDRELFVVAGETLTLELDLAQSGATIAGRVVDAGGAPVPEASVMAWSPSEEDEEIATPSTQSARDGSFTLTVPTLPGRSFTLLALAGPRRVERHDVAPGTHGLELVLPELAALPLRVEDARTHAPVNGYTLYWRASDAGSYERFDSQGARLSAGPDGAYLAELPLGRVDLVVAARAQGYQPCFREGVLVTRQGTQEVRFELENGVDLLLVVQGDEALRGQLRRSFLVSAAQAGQAVRGGDFYQQEIRAAQGLRLDSSGVLRLLGMPTGIYRIERVPGELELSPERFELTAVETERIELALRPKDSPPASQPDREEY